MKFFVAIALFAAAASAYTLPADIELSPSLLAEVEEIMAAIHSPSTDPTTAAMLEHMLFELIGVSPVKPPINVPAIIDGHEPIHVGPAVVDFPIPEGALAPETPEAPAAAAPTTSPLVQIIVNVKDQSVSSSPVQIDHKPTPVHVVDEAEESIIKPTPVIVVEEAGESIIKPTPVIVVEEAGESIFKPTPVDVVEELFFPPEPVLIGNLPEPVSVGPVIVAPAVVAPETLN